MAKEIVETKLDAKLTNVVTISDYRNEKLPAEITQNIQTLSQSLGYVEVDSSFAKHSLDEMSDGQDEEYSKKDLQTVAKTQNEVIQNTIALFESWTDLQMKKAESYITARKYDAELKKLQDQFQKEMQAIDNKSEVLSKALKQINTSRNCKQLKEGLLALSNRQNDLTDQEWDDFFNGTKTIEI